MNKEELCTYMDKFLSERRESVYGEYPEVSSEDIKNLNKILDILISLKFDTDESGIYPVFYKLIDRTRYESFNYFPVPKITEQLEELTEDILMMNLEYAYDELQFYHRLKKIRKK